MNGDNAPVTDTAKIMTEARTFHFHLRAVSDEQKARIESELVATKGVISFLIDTSATRAVIRSTVAADALQKLLLNSGVEVTSVEEKGDPNKTYKAPADENKENARNQGSWFGSWLVPTQQEDTSASWFGYAPEFRWLCKSDRSPHLCSGGGGGGKKKKQQEQAGGWGRLGKVLWG